MAIIEFESKYSKMFAGVINVLLYELLNIKNKFFEFEN